MRDCDALLQTQPGIAHQSRTAGLRSFCCPARGTPHIPFRQREPLRLHDGLAHRYAPHVSSPEPVPHAAVETHIVIPTRSNPIRRCSMKSRTLSAALLASAIAVTGGAAYAQLNLKQFGIGGGGDSSGGGAATGAASAGGVTQLLQNYVGANQQVLAGQSSLASAMGLSSAAGQAQQASSLLSGGTPSVSQLTQVGNTQQSLSQTLTQAFANPGGAAASGNFDKQAFSNGLASLGSGVSQYSSLQSSLGSVGQMNPSSLLQSGLNPQTAQAASYIAQSAPGQLQSLASTLSQAVQFATSHGISVPSIATSALKGF